MSNLIADRGTTLVEALIAIGILAGAVVALAGLSSVAVRSSALARERSVAALLALQKLETECLGAATSPPSPANAWAVDTPGYVEYLDRYGSLLAGRALLRDTAATLKQQARVPGRGTRACRTASQIRLRSGPEEHEPDHPEDQHRETGRDREQGKHRRPRLGPAGFPRGFDDLVVMFRCHGYLLGYREELQVVGASRLESNA